MAAGTNAKVIVIGPGAAGVRAAHALVEAGLRRTIIDEEGRDGGQIIDGSWKRFRARMKRSTARERSARRPLHRDFDALKSRIDYKRSGIGREYGIEGIEAYLETQAILGFQASRPSTPVLPARFQ